LAGRQARRARRTRSPELHIGLSFRHTRGDYGISRNGQKTYGSVLGTIFFGGVGSLLAAVNQQLATEKIQKNRKNAKKSVKYFPWDPHISAKRGGF
jgi:hypothetical protein